jgi:glutathione S-transferase
MKLFTHPLSPYSAKVRVALAEKALHYDEVSLPITRNAVLDKPAELLAINPRGQVPALVDGDVRLYDSTVINEYLESRYPEPALLPADLPARARARQLEDHGDWLLAGCVGELINEVYRKPDPAQQDAAKVATIAATIAGEYARLERELDGRDWLAGDFGLADVACFVPAFIAAAFGAPPSSAHPRVGAWLARCMQRPTIAREVAGIRDALAKLPD